MKYVLFILFAFTVGCGQPLVIQIEDLPDNTPLNEPVYITGNFNGWEPGDPTYQINRNPEGGGYIEIPRGIGHLEFKFTRGSWNSEEVDSCGNIIPNRYISNFELENVRVQVHQWKDIPLNFCDGVELLIEVPEQTPFPSEIYLMGDFNNWEPARAQFRAQHVDGNTYRIELPSSYIGNQYKITRGTSTSVEVSNAGKDIDNRIVGGREEQRISVEYWKDLCLVEHPYRYIVIRGIPESTPSPSSLYFASNINGWDPSDPESRFKRMSDGRYVFRVANTPDNIEFKVTRGGSWGTVETGPNGYEISNRILEFGIQDTVEITVYNWKDR